MNPFQGTTPLKINMEPKKMEVWKMIFLFQTGDFQVPAINFPGCRFFAPKKDLHETTFDGFLPLHPLVDWGEPLNFWDEIFGSPVFAGGFCNVFISKKTTPGKINMEPENTPLEKEKHLPNHHFQVLC